MKESARYAKIVEWSEEDHCYVGSVPGLIYGGTHGNDEKAVFEELCQIVEACHTHGIAFLPPFRSPERCMGRIGVEGSRLAGEFRAFASAHQE